MAIPGLEGLEGRHPPSQLAFSIEESLCSSKGFFILYPMNADKSTGKRDRDLDLKSPAFL